MYLLASLSFDPGSLSLPLAELNHFGIGPFLIPLAAMGLGLAGIIFGSLDKMQKRRLRHELLRVALEKGQPLPAELLDEPQARRNRDDRRSGLIALAVGVALLFNWALERHADNGQKPS